MIWGLKIIPMCCKVNEEMAKKKHGKLVSYFSKNTLGHTYYGIDKRHCKRVSPLTRRCQVCIYYIYINQSIAAQVQYM